MTTIEEVLAGIGTVAIAVSGGIDSLTLATQAHRVLGQRATMHHATSPAVPAEATERTQREAMRQGWVLDIFNAGEFADPRYRENPVNRCFFCKTNLYGAIASRTSLQIVSGTNTDDLGEYRPGLDAARDYNVRHPFVEAGIGKARIRQLATQLGLGALAELPSAPCLSSRIETGLRIEAPVLGIVHEAEKLVARALAPRTVRCRVRASGIVIELDDASLANLSERHASHLRRAIAKLGTTRPITFASYVTGSAFVHAPAEARA